MRPWPTAERSRAGRAGWLGRELSWSAGTWKKGPSPPPVSHGGGAGGVPEGSEVVGQGGVDEGGAPVDGVDGEDVGGAEVLALVGAVGDAIAGVAVGLGLRVVGEEGSVAAGEGEGAEVAALAVHGWGVWNLLQR